MSKSVKRVVGVVAAIAIPFAAPAIATSIGLSAAVGSTIGSAVTGAALGAGTAALTDQDIARGALLGGISGGIGGYTSGASATGGAEGAINTATGGAGVDAAQTAGTLGGQAGASTGFGAPISGGESLNAAVGSGQLAGAVAGGQAGSAAAQTFAANQAANMGYGQRFIEAIKQAPSEMVAKFSDPRQLADLTLRAAGQLAGSLVAGDGLTDEERQLLDAQRQELEYLQANNEALFQQRLSEAQKLLGEARYFDPQYFGLQAASEAQISGARQREAALADVDPRRAGLRSAEERRANLDIGRDVAAAYSRGFGTGVEQQTRLRQAGLDALPAGAPQTYTSSAGQQVANTFETARRNRAQTQQDIGSFIEPFMGRDYGFGEEDEDNRASGRSRQPAGLSAPFTGGGTTRSSLINNRSLVG